MKNRLLALGFFLLLTGCTVPGTYISPGSLNAQTQSTTDEKWMHPVVIPIDENLLQKKGPGGQRVFKQPPEYRLGSFDALNIIVLEHPELAFSSSTLSSIPSVDQTSVTDASTSPVLAPSQDSTGYPIDSNGYIYFPYVGKVQVAGLTIDQTRDRLANRLSKYIRNPQVSVSISTYRSRQVFMIGELNKQGILPLTDKPMSLFDAINRSGGIASLTSDASHIYIIRGARTDNVLRVYWLDAKTPQTLVLSEYFYLQPDDIVDVTPTGIASWNRIISIIMPTVQTLWYTYSLVSNFHT